MSPTFLGMLWEELRHCSRMRLQAIPNLVSVELQPDESGPLLSGAQEKTWPGRQEAVQEAPSQFPLSPAASLNRQQLEGADNAVCQ